MMEAVESEQLATKKRFAPDFPALRCWHLNKEQTAALAVILLLVFIVYSRSLFDGFVFDDFPQIVLNYPLRRWSFVWLSWTRDLWWYIGPSSHPHSAYYRPIQNTFLAVVFPIVGTSALRWHMVKILLHLVVIALTFRLSQLLTASTATSLVAALLFGVITVHAEPIVWISAFHEPITAIFELGAFCKFVQRPRGKLSGLLLPILLFSVAAFAHESAVVFPFLLAAYVILLDYNFDANGNRHDPQDRVVWSRSRFGKAFLLGLPFAAVEILYLGARLYSLGFGAFLGVSHKAVQFYRVGNQIQIRTNVVNPPAVQILNTLPLVIVTYLEIFVLPWRAGPAHPVRFALTRTLENFYQPLLLLLLLGLVGCFMLRNNVCRRLYLFCALWWLIATLPALNLNQVVSLVQDRYEYIPSVGLCIFVARLSMDLAGNSARWQRTIALCLVCFIGINTIVLWRIESVWRDNLTMFTKCVEIIPDSVFYREQLATVFRNRDDLAGAAEQLTIASKSDPQNYMIHSQLVEIYSLMGRKADADHEFRAYLNSIAPWSLGARSRGQAEVPYQ